MADVITEVSPSTSDPSTGRWMASIFNNDYNTMDQVIEALMQATRCDAEEAIIETWEAETYGKAPVHFASHDECQEVCTVLSRIGLKTEVAPEWQN